jgi:hypothetical protein
MVAHVSGGSFPQPICPKLSLRPLIPAIHVKYFGKRAGKLALVPGNKKY